MASVLERVRILLTSQDSPSRNLNYSEFSDEEGKQVFRLYRLYLCCCARWTTRRASPR